MTSPSRASPVHPGPPSAAFVDREHRDGAAVVHDHNAKRRRSDATKKSTSVLKREARGGLVQEVRELEAQLEELRVRMGLPSTRDKAIVSEIQGLNARLEQALCVNDNFLRRAQSMTDNELLSPPVNTMSTFIHLPQDMAQRRAILHKLQPTKLRRGIEVVTETFRHLDPLMPFAKEIRFSANTGELQCHRFEISQHRNFRTARQLFDIAVGFLSNMEINVTETFGLLTLREDSDDVVDPTIWNHRYVTYEDEIGCVNESNCVSFAGFYNHSPITNSPLGIIVGDTVNIDDLYPYLPHERTCKDIQVAHLVYEVRKPGSDEVVVVLKQCFFFVQLSPQFEVASGALAKIHQDMTRWPKLFTKYLHEYVVLEESQPATKDTDHPLPQTS